MLFDSGVGFHALAKAFVASFFVSLLWLFVSSVYRYKLVNLIRALVCRGFHRLCCLALDGLAFSFLVLRRRTRHKHYEAGGTRGCVCSRNVRRVPVRLSHPLLFSLTLAPPHPTPSFALLDENDWLGLSGGLRRSLALGVTCWLRRTSLSSLRCSRRRSCTSCLEPAALCESRRGFRWQFSSGISPTLLAVPCCSFFLNCSMYYVRTKRRPQNTRLSRGTTHIYGQLQCYLLV